MGPSKTERGSRSGKQGVVERMRREIKKTEKKKRVWRHRRRRGDHTVQFTLEALTLSSRDRHQGEGKG